MPEEPPSRRAMPFEGSLTFDLTLVLLGQAVVRKLRVRYEYRPEWDYFDDGLGAVIPGGPETTCTTMWLQVDPGGVEISYLADTQGHPISHEKLAQPLTHHLWLDWEDARWIRADTLNELQVLPFEMWALIDAQIDKKSRLEDGQRRVKHLDPQSRKPKPKRPKRKRRATKAAAPLPRPATF